MSPGHELYPMPLFPRLTVSDVAESTDWYGSLGFEVVYSMPAMAHVRYRKYADVVLASESTVPFDADSPPDGGRGVGVAVYITVESKSIDDVANRARAHGIDVGDGPRETPWNTRELPVTDPDGNEFVFSEGPVDPGKAFDDVVGQRTGLE